jgi:LPS sulfotransferase NodH
MTPPEAVRFVIFAAPRTGSNLLCSLLNAHPDILCHRGLFNPDGIHWADERCARAGLVGGIEDRDRDPRSFLEAVWSCGRDAGAVGFKMNRGENVEAADALLRDLDVRKILLRRRNRLRTYISEEIARLTGVWESFDEPVEADLPSIRVEPDDLARHSGLNAAYYAEFEAVLRSTGQTWLETDYEALAESEEMARILAFLGVQAGPALPAECRKRGPSDLGEVVANLDELAAALRGTAWFDDLSSRDAPHLSAHRFAP